MRTDFSRQDGVSLKEHLERRLDALDATVCLKIKAVEDSSKNIYTMSQLAINKAEASVNERLAGMNEFRGQLTDQAASFISHPLYDQQMLAIADKIKLLDINLNSRIDVLTKTFDQRIKELELERAKVDGKASQNSMIIALVASLLGIALSIISLVSKLGF